MIHRLSLDLLQAIIFFFFVFRIHFFYLESLKAKCVGIHVLYKIKYSRETRIGVIILVYCLSVCIFFMSNLNIISHLYHRTCVSTGVKCESTTKKYHNEICIVLHPTSLITKIANDK